MSNYEGYYQTYDAGHIDDDGYIWIMSRTDDIINVAGHRLSTGAIEEVLSDHQSVAECAVIGIADKLKGQLPIGLIALKAGVDKDNETISKECIQMVRDKVGPVAAFKTAIVVKRLPKTRSGKILRGTVRKIADSEEYKMPATIDDPAILDEIKKRSAKYAGIKVEFVELQKGPPTGKPLKLLIKSDNTSDLDNATSIIRKHLNTMVGLTNIEDDRDLPGIEWQLTVDRTQALKFGVDIALVGNYVQLITKGLKVTDYSTEVSDEEIDVVIRYPKHYRKLNQYERISIKTNKGLIPIDNFIKWSPKPKIGVIKRVQSIRTKTIQADVAPGILADSKAKEIKAWLNTADLPRSVRIQFKGEDAEQKQAKSFLIKAFAAALFIMTIILVTQFNSFYSAFLILSAVIMSTAGVFLGLLITGEPFGIVMSGVGVIALAGIVVNNNIVLIDTFDHIKRTSISVQQAILVAGAQRLRPVLLTTITTVLGLMPMVFQTNIDFLTREITVGAPSTQWWVSLSTTIVFGLSFATVLTLIVTPCALMLRSNLTAWREERFSGSRRQN